MKNEIPRGILTRIARFLRDPRAMEGKARFLRGEAYLRKGDHDMALANLDGGVFLPLDLGKVMIVNSTGLGILIAALTSMKNAGGILKLLNVSKRVESLLMVTKLILIFDVFENEEEAMASFS